MQKLKTYKLTPVWFILKNDKHRKPFGYLPAHRAGNSTTFYDPQVARFASEMATRESQIRMFLIQAQSDLNYALILKNQRNFLRAHSLFKNGNKTSCF